MKNKLFFVFVFALLTIGLAQIQPAQADGGDGYIIIDQVWHDMNMNGIQDEPGIGESGGPNIAGMKVELYACGTTTPLATKSTNVVGKASFVGLAEGNYYVKFYLDPGFTDYVFSPRLQGSDTQLDSDPYPDGTTDCFFVPSHPGGTKFVDAGIYQPVKKPIAVKKTASGFYDRTVTWTLMKSASPTTFSGFASEIAGSTTWTVTATKIETLGNYQVTGTIIVNNPNTFPVEFSVTDVLNDGTQSSVNCPTYTASANSNVTCTYTAAPNDGSATLNTVTVTSLTDGVSGANATAGVAFSETLIGYDSGTLSDDRFEYSEVISTSKTKTFDETFVCPVDDGQYVNGQYHFSEVNTAALNGNINLAATATVNISCEKTGKGETAWAEGAVYPGHVWFMYTPYNGNAQTVNLIAGQNHIAGTVSFSNPVNQDVTITISLLPGWQFENGLENVKIERYQSAPTAKPKPGQFTHKGNASGSTFSIVVPQANFMESTQI